MRLLFDAEADGLYPTKLWCISAIDIDSREVYEYGPDQLDEGLELLSNATMLLGHNIISYDLPHIKRLHGIDLSHIPLCDTLVLSRLINPTREGGHSLEAWGVKLGFAKVEHEDWTKYTKAMQHRCTMDVRLNVKVYRRLMIDGKDFSEDSIELEHEVAKIMHQQEETGWLFDSYKANSLLAEVNDELGRTQDKVHETFKPKVFFEKRVVPKFKKDGTLSKSGLREDEYDALIKSGDYSPFDRTYTQVFNLSSRQQIGIWLQDFGWKPTKFTDGSKGKAKKDRQPTVDEKVLAGIKGIPEADLINRYLFLSKIRGFLVNWLDSVGEDGRQHGYVNPMGAVTGRMSHSKPNLAQVPSSKKEYGAECRSLFIVPEGYKLVGMDAAALELRMLASYMRDSLYVEAAVSGTEELGTDIHTVNMNLAGLSSRDQAKTMYYALIYGAGDSKLGSIIGGKAAAGRQLKDRLFNEIPNLSDLIERIQTAATKGYIKGLDGRLIKVRNVYSALNTLLQGGGAIVMKRALILLNQYATDAGLDFKFVGNIHDEIQAEVLEEHAERFAELAEIAMEHAGEYYNMFCPLAGNAKIGNNWSETH